MSITQMLRRCPLCAETFDEFEAICPQHGVPLVRQLLNLNLGHAHDRHTGKILDDRYLLGAQIGEGGMGCVYEGEQIRISRQVAIKFLHPLTNTDSKLKLRLFREMRATSLIRQINIVEILDYGHDDTLGLYYVMEYLEGQSIQKLLQAKSRLPIDMVLKIAIQICDALNATEKKGLLHRDLKPSNVWIKPSGLVKVLDFGLVRRLEPSDSPEFSTLTTENVLFGTPAYMSPEQASCKGLDSRSDLYSVGTMLYEMLTGATPFESSSPIELINLKLNRPITFPSDACKEANIPSVMDLALIKVMARNPEERHANALAFKKELILIAEKLGIETNKSPYDLQKEWPEITTTEIPINPATLTRRQSDPIEPSLGAFATERVEDIVSLVVRDMCALNPKYREQPKKKLEEEVALFVRAAIDALIENQLDDLASKIESLIDTRSEQNFGVVDIFGSLLVAFSRYREVLRNSIAPQKESIDDFIVLQRSLDQRLIPICMQILNTAVNKFHGRISKMNHLLTQQNVELNELRLVLNKKIEESEAQIVQLKHLKTLVANSVASGLLLIERGSRNVTLFNNNLERLTGISASNVIGRNIDELLDRVKGVPAREFIDLIRTYGHIGPRKLEVELPNQAKRRLLVRAESIEESDKTRATLFVVEDVTERDRTIDLLESYLPKPVVQTLYREDGALLNRVVVTEGAVVLFSATIDASIFDVEDLGSGSDSIATIVGEFVSSVNDAVEEHGGAVYSIHGCNLLACFRNMDRDATPSLRAASACLEANRRSFGLKIRIKASVDVGRVSILFTGDDRRRTCLLLGRAVENVLAIGPRSAPDKISVTSAVVERSGGQFEFEAKGSDLDSTWFEVVTDDSFGSTAK